MIRPHFAAFVLLLATLSLALLGAQEPLRPAALPPLRAPTPLQRVLWDRDGDGDTWALARQYRLRFGAHVVEFVPFLGSAAPRTYPLALQLVAVRWGAATLPVGGATLQRTQDRVVLDRGTAQEIWTAGLDTAEQSFVIQAPVARPGDLSLRLAVTTDLEFLGQDDLGLRFGAPGLGKVRYGHAVAIDARGRRLTIGSRWSGGGIELDVPGWFTAEAAWPVTIDPVVSLFDVANSTRQQLNSDCAYLDSTTDRFWAVVFDDRFATNDDNILMRRYDETGAFIDEIPIEITAANTRRPSVAAAGSQSRFLVSWEVVGSSGAAAIAAREVDASASVLPVFSVSTGTTDHRNPCVAGCLRTAPDNQQSLLVWDVDAGAGARNIVGRLFNHNVRTLGPLFAIASTTADERLPRASRGRAVSDTWLVAFASDSGARFVGVTTAGTLVGSLQDFETGAADATPDVAGDGDRFVVLTARAVSVVSTNLFCRRLTRRLLGFSGAAAFDLSALEPGVTSRFHTQPRLAFDGCRFSYIYQDALGGTLGDQTFAATFRDVTPPVFEEGHVRVLTETNINHPHAITARTSGSGSAGRYLITTGRIRPGTSPDVDIRAALWDGTQPGASVSVVSTLCSNSPRPDDLVLQPTSLPPCPGADIEFFLPTSSGGTVLYLVGPPSVLPIPLCAGVGTCKLGVGQVLFSSIGQFLAFQIPCDPGLLGGTIAVQAFEIFTGNHAGCGTVFAPFDFHTTNTYHLTLR